MSAIRRMLGVSVVVLSTTVLVAAPAGAAELPGLLREFGSFQYPTGVAVDQVDGYVYVADGNGGEAVDVFGPEASGPSAVPLAVLTGTGSESFDFGKEPVGVAVDNDPTSASYHDVYVTDVEHNVVDKFELMGPGEYRYACQIHGWYGSGVEACMPTGGSPAQPFVEPVGVAVDASGNVYISSYGPQKGFIAEFDAAGKGVMELSGSEHAGLAGHPEGLVIDSAGDLFVQNYESGREVVKFTFPAPGAGQPVVGSAIAIAINSETNDLYVDNGNFAEVFDTSGEQLEAFAGNPFDELGASRGIAIRNATGEVYGANGSVGSVRVLGLVKVPDVTKCQATRVTATSAVLGGEVNPLEAEGAQYRFEYGTSPAYGQETSFTDIAGNALMPISKEVAGLEPGTTYHCRLDATDTAGLNGSVINKSADETFTTPPLTPVVSGGEVTNVSNETAVFHGLVDPGNGVTSYHFVYGKTAAYGTSLPEIGIGVGLEPIAVEQAPEAPLEPNTVYHYALVGKNSSGEVVGEDHTFMTLPGPAAHQPPVVESSGVSALSPTAVTITGQVEPKLLQTICCIKIGIATTYGTEVFSSLGRGATASTVSATFQGLAPGTLYHFRVTASNAGGVSEGPDMTFTTPGLPAALVPPTTPLLVPTPAFPPVKAPPRPKSKPHRRHSKGKTKKAGKHGKKARVGRKAVRKSG